MSVLLFSHVSVSSTTEYEYLKTYEIVAFWYKKDEFKNVESLSQHFSPSKLLFNEVTLFLQFLLVREVATKQKQTRQMDSNSLHPLVMML